MGRATGWPLAVTGWPIDLYHFVEGEKITPFFCVRINTEPQRNFFIHVSYSY